MPVLGEIPGLAEAVERETFDRLAAFIDVPETAAGIPVQTLTPRLALELEAAGSPFFRGAFPEPCDVAAFLWHVSIERQRKAPWWRSARRWEDRVKQKFVGRVGAMDFVTTALAIQDYIAEAHRDGPGSGESDGPAFASSVSGLVDVVAGHYPFREGDILDMPYKRLWQYWRRIVHRAKSGEETFINELSDKVRDGFLQALNKASQPAA